MSVQVPHLPKAPIVEAMIAFDYESKKAGFERLVEEFADAVKADYPIRQNLQQSQIVFDEKGSTAGPTLPVGSRFTSSVERNVCVVSQFSFMCSRLEPYETWEALRGEFERLWQKFHILSEMEITKVSVRYINKIFLPLNEDMSNYLRTRPEIPSELPRTGKSLFMRLELAIATPPGTLVVTEAQLPDEREGKATFVLDHDLQFPIQGPTDPWAVLSEARRLKNQYFFAAISENLMEEFS